MRVPEPLGLHESLSQTSKKCTHRAHGGRALDLLFLCRSLVPGLQVQTRSLALLTHAVDCEICVVEWKVSDELYAFYLTTILLLLNALNPQAKMFSKPSPSAILATCTLIVHMAPVHNSLDRFCTCIGAGL